MLDCRDYCIIVTYQFVYNTFFVLYIIKFNFLFITAVYLAFIHAVCNICQWLSILKFVRHTLQRISCGADIVYHFNVKWQMLKQSNKHKKIPSIQ